MSRQQKIDKAGHLTLAFVVWIFILILYWKAKLVFHSSSSRSTEFCAFVSSDDIQKKNLIIKTKKPKPKPDHLMIFKRKPDYQNQKPKPKPDHLVISKPKNRAKTWSMIGDHLMIFRRKPDGQMQSEHFCWKVFYASHLFIKYMKLML